MRPWELRHPNIVALKHAFYTSGDSADELYLNMVMEFVPETVYCVMRRFTRQGQHVPQVLVRLYVYQACRALAHLHGGGVVHRDIKPQNLLVDGRTHSLKLCDFGSAKRLVKGEPNVAYICSRYYRAPELIFGATHYTTIIDIWSTACVTSELILGQPIFPGESGVDQLVEIIKVLGTPSKEQIRQMNPNYNDFKFPQIKAHPWEKVFWSRTPQEAIRLTTRLLEYSPGTRLKPMQACAHNFFDELRQPGAKLSNGGPLPPLFNFTQPELSSLPSDIDVKNLYPLSDTCASSNQQQSSSSPSSFPSPQPPHGATAAATVASNDVSSSASQLPSVKEGASGATQAPLTVSSTA